jgi:hypothetical protein
MIDLDLYVIILLLISLVGMTFIFFVVRRQLGLFKLPLGEYSEKTQKQLRHFRITLFAISMTIIISGMIPIALNIYTLLYDTARPDKVPWVSFIYAMGVHLQGLLLSFQMWRLYRLSADNDNTNEFSKKGIEQN